MSDQERMSRRKWVGMMSVPMLAAVGSELISKTTFAAEPTDANLLGAKVYNIRDFGAVGDGKTLDTKAVQAAVDQCDKDGGGTILVPAGTFVIGTVELKSNMTLHIVAAGTLLGSGDGKQYYAKKENGVDVIPLRGDTTLQDGNVGLIFATNCANITIEGAGTIDGQGVQFRRGPNREPPPSGRGGNDRPYSVLFYQCKNVVLRDIFFKDSAYHAIRIVECAYFIGDGLRMHSRVNGNNDGFHFISTHFINISNCTILCQDDACALFGSCKFVTVTNCYFSTRWSVFRFGGGEAENITVSNCLFQHVYGCPIKMQCGSGSRFENMSFSNLVMQDVTGPISIGVGSRGRRRSATTEAVTRPIEEGEDMPTTRRGPGIVRNISFNGIRAFVTASPEPLPECLVASGYREGEMKSCIVLNGVGEAFLEDITLSDINITFGGGGTAQDAATRDVPKQNGEYFELGRLPAYGMYARNVRGLTMQNIRFTVDQPDLRPAVIFDHVEEASVNGLNVQGNPQGESVLRFIDSKDTLLTAPRVLTPAAVFLRLEGAANQNIIVDGGDVSKAAKATEFANGADEKAVQLRM